MNELMKMMGITAERLQGDIMKNLIEMKVIQTQKLIKEIAEMMRIIFEIVKNSTYFFYCF